MGFYIPAAMLLAWGLYGALTLPRWHDPRYVRTPQRRFWGIWHFLDEREWTEEGQAVRQRYLRYLRYRRRCCVGRDGDREGRRIALGRAVRVA